MGEVRSTLESKGTTNPKIRLIEVREQVQDLLTIKRTDLETEGKANAARNRRSIKKLEKAITLLKSAEKELEAY